MNWKIVGGEDAKVGQFPHQASIQVKIFGSWSHNCGGSILNKRYILTASHCIAGQDPEEMQVVVGSNKLDQPGDAYPVIKLIPHEHYSAFAFDNDTGLILLGENIKFNDLVKPVELAAEALSGGEDVVLSGWGTTVVGGETPNDLQFINLKVLDQETCQEKIVSPELTDGHICTFTKTGEGACHGDSGGCLLHEGKCCGIVNFGRPCARGYPDVFARISHYLEWINSHMDNNLL